MGKRSGLSGDKKVFLGVAGVAVLFYLAWIGFIVWAIYSIVSWLVSK